MSAAHHGDSGGYASRHESVYYAAVKRIMSQLNPPILRHFHQLSTDDDRFSYVSALPGVRAALAAASPLSGVDEAGGKSSYEAGRHRQKGNELYKAERLRDAVASYTASMLVAPVTDCGSDDHDAEESGREALEKANSEFVLALGNRSACLLQMKRYNDCLSDVAMALRYGYPRHLEYKLHDRQARALIELGRFDEALESLRRLHSSLSLSKLDPDQRSSIARNAEKKMDFCSSAVVQPSMHKEETDSTATDNDVEGGCPPAVSGSNSDRFPGA